MALGSTQSLTEMSTRNLPGGKGRPARKAGNLTIIYESIIYRVWEPRRLTTLWATDACYRDSFTILFSFNSLTSLLRSLKQLLRFRFSNEILRAFPLLHPAFVSSSLVLRMYTYIQGRYYRVPTMVYNTQKYWVFGLCPSSGFF
jgi:hypothetical protein